jgi:hypothetical protein
MIKPSQSSHWYKPDGEPAYNATLRDARKDNLWPSVTQIIGLLEKPAIAPWMVNLMSEVCYDNPAWLSHEELDDYRARIEPIFQDARSRAANVGTAIHDFAEDCMDPALNGDTPKCVEGYEEQCRLLCNWIDDNLTDNGVSEWTFSHGGYGGRIDWCGEDKQGRLVVIDFKTQDMKDRPNPNYYQEWKWQLAAYKRALDSTPMSIHHDKPYTAISVVINTGDIKKIHVKEYTEAEMDEAWTQFEAIKAAWYAIKGL